MTREEKKLFLIDGNSLLYRAYYAIQRLTNSQGFPTNAIFGFLNTLRKLLDEAKPAYLGVVFDTGRPTVRHQAYKDYKAHRKPMPDDLIVQVPVLKKVLQAMRIPLFEFESYEADDVLGSLAVQAAGRRLQAVIVTTDKDLLQLVNDFVMVYNPAKELWLDEEGVKEFFGVGPAQIVDVLSLWGDPSDNVPGVPGVGEKTSKNLILEFGSLDNLLRNLAQVKNPRIRQAIEENREKLDMSRQLVTIEKGLDVKLELDDFAVNEPDRDELVRLYQELEFSTLLSGTIQKTEAGPKNYMSILEEDTLKDLAARIKKAGYVALDTESDSPSPTRARLVGMSFSLEPGEAYYLPLRHDYPDAPGQIPLPTAFKILRPVLADPQIKIIGQNIKYDEIVLRREGLEIAAPDLDTMVLSYLLEPNWGKHNLDRLALSYLHENTLPYEAVTGKGKNQVTMNAVPVERVTPYACQDADFALRLGRLLWPRVEAEKLDKIYRDIEQPLIPLLAQMEIWGVKVDSGALATLSSEFAEEMARLQAKIHETAGSEFNINSPQQLAHILFAKLNMAPSRKTKITKKFSTSIDVLQELAVIHPLARLVLDYRQMAKLKSTYADALPLLVHPETGRLHTSYNQTVAATGRLSSSEPNLQNIPARGEIGQRFRRAFIPEKGCRLLAADYSQIELRVLAHLSADPALVETFVQDRDIHEETSRRVFGETSSLFKEEQRRKAKVINFSIIYGTSAFSLAKELGTSNAEAQRFIDRYFEQYPRVREFLEQTVREAEIRGYTETLFGRKRPVPELKQRDKVVQQAGRRIALNSPIQGTAADLMKKAMLDIWGEIKACGLESKLILQVHDELVFEVPEKEKAGVEKLVREKMETVFPLHVPLKVHLGWGLNWADAK